MFTGFHSAVRRSLASQPSESKVKHVFALIVKRQLRWPCLKVDADGEQKKKKPKKPNSVEEVREPETQAENRAAPPLVILTQIER